MSKVFIINGAPLSGKDSFIDAIEAVQPKGAVFRISIIDSIKKVAMQLGWDGVKTPEGCKFLADLKTLTDDYNGYAMEQVRKFIMAVPEDAVVFVCCREIKDIECIRSEFDAETIYVKRNVAMQALMSNHADLESLSDAINYDYIVDNNGTLDELVERAREFISKVKGE